MKPPRVPINHSKNIGTTFHLYFTIEAGRVDFRDGSSSVRSADYAKDASIIRAAIRNAFSSSRPPDGTFEGTVHWPLDASASLPTGIFDEVETKLQELTAEVVRRSDGVELKGGVGPFSLQDGTERSITFIVKFRTNDTHHDEQASPAPSLSEETRRIIKRRVPRRELPEPERSKALHDVTMERLAELKAKILAQREVHFAALREIVDPLTIRRFSDSDENKSFRDSLVGILDLLNTGVVCEQDDDVAILRNYGDKFIFEHMKGAEQQKHQGLDMLSELRFRAREEAP